MKVILFGATGMVGHGVLRECLLDADVETVLTIGRSVTGQKNAKLQEIAHQDFLDFSTIAGRLVGYDACFFCMGVSATPLRFATLHLHQVGTGLPSASCRTCTAYNASGRRNAASTGNSIEDLAIGSRGWGVPVN